MVAITRGAIAVVAAIVVGGCRGGEEQEQVFTRADATRIANVRPVMPGWTWPQNPEKHGSPGSRTEPPSTDPLDVELRRQTADIVFPGHAANKWRDADKLANLHAQVVASAPEAHELMAPSTPTPAAGARDSDASPRTRRSRASATRPGSSGRKAAGQR
jgi:hypothetical protein